MQELDDCHLLILSKDGAGFKHFSRAKNELTKEWELFKAWRAAYAVEKDGSAKAAKPKPDVAKPAAAKPRIRVKAQGIRSTTMAEILMAYGHVPPPKQPVQQSIDFRWSRPAQ
jgi:hypothetical protein